MPQSRLTYTMHTATGGLRRTARSPREKVTPTPSPKPAADTPNFTYNGSVRSYYFTRQNCSGYPSNPCVPNSKSSIPGTYKTLNQAAFNTALLLHGDYRFKGSHWHAGATYIYANPLGVNGPCSPPSNYASLGQCSQYPENNNYLSSDTTLPGFILSTLAEAYVQYRGERLNAIAGDQLFTSPWAGPSDSRIKAAYYEGIDANYSFGKRWSIGVSRMTQWENRTSSNFNKSNLVVPLAPDGSIANPTTGFLLLQSSYRIDPQISARAQYYSFYEIASLLWLEGRWSWAPASPLKPSIAVQFGRETNAGTSLVGNINSSVAGASLGARFWRTVDVSLNYDYLPWRRAVAVLPHGVTCTNHVISSSTPTGGTGYWLPIGGTPNCVPGTDNTATIYYGGIASPYTDSYNRSPLFTTAESQDVVERRSAGQSARLIVTVSTNNRKLRVILARALDDFNNGAGSAWLWGTDVEVEYYFNPVTTDRYHGLSLIERWAQRTQSNTELFGGIPLFIYNRVQLEYTF
jgi:hypothetical protein